MELDTIDFRSPLLDGDLFKKQIERIQMAADDAQDIIDYTTAHNEEVLRSIDIVEKFLRKKHRLCYGGQAINAHMPKGHKIYNPETSIPDYDFFTPDQDDDIRTLSHDLRKAGFIEISAREGMHEGTIKIYVNYIPVADITILDAKLYQLLAEREFRQDGISYLDSNTLRMFMYLELSRPRGEVTRWRKVYERLLTMNKYVAINNTCKTTIKEKQLLKGEVNTIMQYCVREKRIFAGADLLGYYRSAFTGTKKARWLINTRKPIYIYTYDLDMDTKYIREQLPLTKVHHIKAMGGDLIPDMSIISRNSYPVVVLISQSACHSYYSVPLKFDNTLRIATLDTLIALYFSLSLLKYKHMDLGALECLAQELVEVSYRSRSEPDKFPFPFISLECSGHQKRLASLIREKVQRITTEKKGRLRRLIKEKSNAKKTFRNRKWWGDK